MILFLRKKFNQGILVRIDYTSKNHHQWPVLESNTSIASYFSRPSQNMTDINDEMSSTSIMNERVNQHSEVEDY